MNVAFFLLGLVPPEGDSSIDFRSIARLPAPVVSSMTMCSGDDRGTCPLLPSSAFHHSRDHHWNPGRDPNLSPSEETLNGRSPNSTSMAATRDCRLTSTALALCPRYRDPRTGTQTLMHRYHRHGRLYIVGVDELPCGNIPFPRSHENTSYRMPPDTPYRTEHASRIDVACCHCEKPRMPSSRIDDALFHCRRHLILMTAARRCKPPPSGAMPRCTHTQSLDRRI
mmetsp:Transcript_4130/g.7328  ORF Transcript_4130/g.7328 Transcript_4130/m.7328 type:complete len:225 (+) Transcript_4130:582-1256(+)